ncbi:MAG: ABC transporter permease [Betaproteobacteria bacterium]|nr:ABC transporter permease [Betaproteobacteria bacterium]
MWRLAYRQLMAEPLRAALTACAIAAAIAVILVLRGFEQGLYAQLEAAVTARGAPLIVAQAGVSNFIATRSSLPQLARERVEAIAGVAQAQPITGLSVIYGPEGNRVPIYLLVHDRRGGPGRIVQGGPIRGARDTVIDEGLARRYGLRPGDPLVISDFRFRVAGITRGESAMFMPFVFIGYDGMIDLFLESEIAPDLSTFPLLSYLLVDLAPGAQAEAVAELIEHAVPEADVFTADTLAANDVALGKELFGPIMQALIGLAYLVGVLVIGLIVYADAIGRRRTFGVMNALGFRLRHMLATLSAQTLMLLALAWPLGIGIALAIAAGIESLAPVYRVYVLEPAGLAWALAGVLAMALLGAVFPLRVVARADPTTAFQAG